MSRPGPAATASGRADAHPAPSRVPRARPPGGVVRVESEVVGRGPATASAPPRRSPTGAPARRPAPYRPVVAVRDGQAGSSAPPGPPTEGSDDTLLPARALTPARRLTLVERVTLVLRSLGGVQGRHRPGRSRDGWSMFAPHRSDRRRGAGWARR